jgi:hypothetical protein
MRWYISVACVKEFQAIAGYPIQSDGPSFDRAEKELAALCDGAELKKAMGEGSDNAAIYQAKTEIRGRSHRIEMYVAETPRPEGPLAQLVRVRDKDASGKCRGAGAVDRRQQRKHNTD